MVLRRRCDGVGERFLGVLHPVKRGVWVSLVQHPQPDLGAF